MWTNPDFVDGPAGSDTKRLFYGAYQQWSADSNPKDGNNTGVGVVAMTTDRFAYFTNLNLSYPGQLTTKPFSIGGTSGGSKGCRITVNADTTAQAAGAGAELRIELLSASGYRLHGWSKASALPITKTSGIALPTLWGATTPPGPPLKTECHSGESQLTLTNSRCCSCCPAVSICPESCASPPEL
jgi:hypothetical protein